MKKNSTYIYITISVMFFVFTGCKKLLNIPEDLDYFSERADYTVKSYTPILGRTTVITNVFNFDNSSLPLTFQLQNPRLADGTPTNQLTQNVPVWVWSAAYDGKETSLQQILDKRKQESHPLWEVRKSGDFILWQSANNQNIQAFQGSSSPNGYLFDVKVSNSGGEKLIKDLAVRPIREIPYEPSNTDAISGLPKDSILPSELSGMIGQNLRRSLSNDSRDVYIYFKKVGNGNSLTFKFWDKNRNLMNINQFNTTDWTSLVHGFNMQKTSEYVKYTLAYPIPLIKLPTKYTNADGSRALVEFSYSRLGFNGVRETGRLRFNFSIFKEGDWEIYFHFRNDTPRFQDEF